MLLLDLLDLQELLLEGQLLRRHLMLRKHKKRPRGALVNARTQRRHDDARKHARLTFRFARQFKPLKKYESRGFARAGQNLRFKLPFPARRVPVNS